MCSVFFIACLTVAPCLPLFCCNTSRRVCGKEERDQKKEVEKAYSITQVTTSLMDLLSSYTVCASKKRAWRRRGLIVSCVPTINQRRDSCMLTENEEEE